MPSPSEKTKTSHTPGPHEAVALVDGPVPGRVFSVIRPTLHFALYPSKLRRSWNTSIVSTRKPDRDALADGTYPIGSVLCTVPNDAESKLYLAAPDLLAACKAALEFRSQPRTSDGWQQLSDNLTAAINKATGITQ